MTNPDIQWIATSPGRMTLPTTKFEIFYVKEHGTFHLEWDGGTVGSYGSLAAAQEGARTRMADLIAMGIEV